MNTKYKTNFSLVLIATLIASSLFAGISDRLYIRGFFGRMGLRRSFYFLYFIRYPHLAYRCQCFSRRDQFRDTLRCWCGGFLHCAFARQCRYEYPSSTGDWHTITFHELRWYAYHDRISSSRYSHGSTSVC